MSNARIRAFFILFCAFSLVTTRVWAAESFVEEFDEGWDARWIQSSDTKYNGKFEVVDIEVLEDPALKVPNAAQHYGISALLPEPVDPSEGVILQYEAKWGNGHTCGGGYLKFFTHDPDFTPKGLVSDSPYTIMFGPDKCGATNKVHFIMRYQLPVDSTIEEKHLKKPPRVPVDSNSHVYTVKLTADNKFELLIDGKEESSGSLFEEFDPPFNPPKEIPDPEDKKPEDWVDEAKIQDPDAVKPEDWVDDITILDEAAEKPEGWLDDEPTFIPDPAATMPEDWDEEEDGEWVPPEIENPKCVKAPGCGEWKRPRVPNPDYKGEWRAPMIDNPKYKGPWKQQTIPNPKFFEDDSPLKSIGKIGAVGIEIWTMDSGIFFDNVIVTQDELVAADYRNKWEARNSKEEAAAEELRKAMAQKTGASKVLEDLANHPALEAVKPYILQVADLAENNALAFYVGLFGAGAFIFISLACCCCRGGGKADAGVAKKEDITGADDEEETEEPEDVTEPAEDAGTSVTESKHKDDDEDDDDEIEEVNEGPRTRRRARRAD